MQSSGDIDFSIQMAVANATACILSVGAKAGLLKKGEKFATVKIAKDACAQSGLCKCKVC